MLIYQPSLHPRLQFPHPDPNTSESGCIKNSTAIVAITVSNKMAGKVWLPMRRAEAQLRNRFDDGSSMIFLGEVG